MVIQIYSDERPQHVISKEFNVSSSAIGSIKTGRTWSHVTDHDVSTNTGRIGKNTKLSPDQVIEIFHDPRTHHAIAPEYGISPASVGLIKQGKQQPSVTAHLRENKD